MRLFCFPFAGGTASSFFGWRSAASGSLEVLPVEYPGRGSRWKECGRATLNELVEGLVAELRAELRNPYALLGHSFGALVGFELTRALKRVGAPLPVRLLISGARAPHLPHLEEIHHLPDDEFIARLASYDGVPREVMENEELLSLLLPLVRDDFRLFERYTPRPVEALPIPISAFGGLRDCKIPAADLMAWSAYTVKSFRSRFFSGGHFFLYEHQAEVLRAIAEDVQASVPDASEPPRDGGCGERSREAGPQ